MSRRYYTGSGRTEAELRGPIQSDAKGPLIDGFTRWAMVYMGVVTAIGVGFHLWLAGV